MYMLRFFVLIPLLESNGLNEQMGNFCFLLLALSTMLLAAAGYIINDLYDVDADMKNKPEKVVIGKSIKLRKAENLHLLLNAIAVAIGIYISYRIGLRSVSLSFLLVAGLLYFYSTTYKGQLVFGNILVAFFAALVPLMVVMFELPLLNAKYKLFLSPHFNFNYLLVWFIIYAVFAFLISFAREIVKDMEDFSGDAANGYNTLPVKCGMKFSKIVTISVLTVTAILVFYFLIVFIHDPVSLVYILPFIVLPLIYTGYFILKASGKNDYEKASLYLKLIMLAGIFYSPFVKFILLYHQ